MGFNVGDLYTLHIKYDTNAKDYDAKKQTQDTESKSIDNMNIDCGYRISKPNIEAL